MSGGKGKEEEQEVRFGGSERDRETRSVKTEFAFVGRQVETEKSGRSLEQQVELGYD